ncbi:MAG: tetratricopeptide repeat protein [Desulfobacteraceae bacterium]|nr:tetratricopeptide repeat protein [Desulfobacteraceae bacterium]
MNYLDDLPKRESTHDTAEEAETALRKIINTCKLFVIQSEDRNDYGTDIQIEARDGESMTNIRAHIQLKGTKSNTKANGDVSVSVARANLNYLLMQADSIYICYHLPSNRLLVRFAEDVYHEYEHKKLVWHHQKSITVNFSQLFDEKFQQNLNSRLLASAKSMRDRRLKSIVTPPEQISALIKKTNATIEVPTEPSRAKAVLTELYNSGNDAVISNSFAQFAATLDSLPGGMDMAYMAEINLGINGTPFDEARVKQGIQVLQKSIERGEAYKGSLLYCQGNAWLALREYEKARDIYQSALSLLNTSELADIAAQCCKNMGSVLEKLGEYDEARNYYEQALELNPELNEAHFALALWYHKKRSNPSLALKHLDKIIVQRDSALQMSTVKSWRIELFFKTGEINGAFREIFDLLGKTNQFEWFWPWCARLVAYFGKSTVESVQKALTFWNRFLREHPKDSYAEREFLLCTWFLHDAGADTDMNFTEFKSAIVQLIENGIQDSAFLWDRLGHWAQSDGNWPEAAKAYRKAYKLEPKPYGYCYGTALNFLERYNEALPILFRQAKEHLPDAMSWFQVAKARNGVGAIQGSIKAYQRALELDPEYDLAWFNLGGMYWNYGDYKRASEVWCEAVKRFPNHELSSKLYQEFPFLFEKNHDEYKHLL